MDSKNNIISEIVKMADDKYPNAEIYLYGSHARGDSTKLSDWDLLVLLNQANVPFELETQVMDDFYDLELETGAIISPLIYSKSDWTLHRAFTPLYKNIQKEGIKIK